MFKFYCFLYQMTDFSTDWIVIVVRSRARELQTLLLVLSQIVAANYVYITDLVWGSFKLSEYCFIHWSSWLNLSFSCCVCVDFLLFFFCFTKAIFDAIKITQLYCCFCFWRGKTYKLVKQLLFRVHVIFLNAKKEDLEELSKYDAL